MDFLAYSQWSKDIDESSFALSKTEIMQTKQTIAVIGATGNMGSAISKSLSKGNYRLLLGATD
jgi:predicted amino acid dehydrogenase